MNALLALKSHENILTQENKFPRKTKFPGEMKFSYEFKNSPYDFNFLWDFLSNFPMGPERGMQFYLKENWNSSMNLQINTGFNQNFTGNLFFPQDFFFIRWITHLTGKIHLSQRSMHIRNLVLKHVSTRLVVVFLLFFW